MLPRTLGYGISTASTQSPASSPGCVLMLEVDLGWLQQTRPQERGVLPGVGTKNWPGSPVPDSGAEFSLALWLYLAIPGQWCPTPVLLPGESQGRQSLVGCSPWGREESDTLSDFTFTFHFHALEKEMATHSMFLPGESQGWGSLVGCRLWGRTELDTTEVTSRKTTLLWQKSMQYCKSNIRQ